MALQVLKGEETVSELSSWFGVPLHQQLRAGEVADLTSGTQIRDYMDVDDAARLLVQDALSDREGATNICSSNGRTVAQIAKEVADVYGRRDLLNFGARPDNLSDPPVVVGIRPS